MFEPHLPFFVYGTLRPGEGNYSWALAGKTTQEQTATLDGATMYGNRGFPYVILTPDEERTVTGTLCHVQESKYQETMHALDSLEGYHGPNQHNHYDRVIRTVQTENGDKIQAYVYVASGAYADGVRSSQPVIESGDWLEHIGATLVAVRNDTDRWWETYR